MGFCDLHSHVLPGLDDGAKSLAESIELTTVLGEIGFDVVCATPHQRVGMFVPSREAIDSAYAEVRGAVPSLDLRLGAENFWDELFLERWPKTAQPCYTGERAFLFEINPSMAPPRLEETLFQIRMTRRLPVMAHPERYQQFWDKNFSRYERARNQCALVIDLGALDGAHGRTQCTTARRLVEEGLAHAAASDIHSVADARAAGAGIAWMKKRCGADTVEKLLAENPRRILNGEIPD
jgi:protein-tyrosine phosphatase